MPIYAETEEQKEVCREKWAQFWPAMWKLKAEAPLKVGQQDLLPCGASGGAGSPARRARQQGFWQGVGALPSAGGAGKSLEYWNGATPEVVFEEGDGPGRIPLMPGSP